MTQRISDPGYETPEFKRNLQTEFVNLTTVNAALVAFASSDSTLNQTLAKSGLARRTDLDRAYDYNADGQPDLQQFVYSDGTDLFVLSVDHVQALRVASVGELQGSGKEDVAALASAVNCIYALKYGSDAAAMRAEGSGEGPAKAEGYAFANALDTMADAHIQTITQDLPLGAQLTDYFISQVLRAQEYRVYEPSDGDRIEINASIMRDMEKPMDLTLMKPLPSDPEVPGTFDPQKPADKATKTTKI